MKYSIIGFPRIGIHRELKFETEKYFRNEITQIQYLEFVREQRALQWNKQLEKIGYKKTSEIMYRKRR